MGFWNALTDSFQAYIWKLDTGTSKNKENYPEYKPILTLNEGHSDQIRCVKFLDQSWSPNNVIDGHSIVTAADDGCVRLWRPDLYSEIEHPDRVVDFDPDYVVQQNHDEQEQEPDEVDAGQIFDKAPQFQSKSQEVPIEIIPFTSSTMKKLPHRINSKNKFSPSSTPMKQKNRQIQIKNA